MKVRSSDTQLISYCVDSSGVSLYMLILKRKYFIVRQQCGTIHVESNEISICLNHLTWIFTHVGPERKLKLSKSGMIVYK